MAEAVQVKHCFLCIMIIIKRRVLIVAVTGDSIHRMAYSVAVVKIQDQDMTGSSAIMY